MSEVEPKITIELHKHGAVFKIEGRDEAELDKALAKAIAFAKRNEKRLKSFSIDSNALHEMASRRSEDESSEVTDFAFADWFPYDTASVSDAVATVLYEMKTPLTTGQIAKILTKAWKPMDVRNVSKIVTMKGRYLAPYIYRSEDGKGIQLTAAGRKWVETEILPKLKSVSQ